MSFININSDIIYQLNCIYNKSSDVINLLDDLKYYPLLECLQKLLYYTNNKQLFAHVKNYLNHEINGPQLTVSEFNLLKSSDILGVMIINKKMPLEYYFIHLNDII